MIKFKDTDRILIISTLLLVVVGVVMVYSTSYIVAMKRFGDEYFFVKKHLTYAVAGVLCMIVASRIPYELYRKLAYPILVLSVLFLIFIYIPGFGFTAGGARRWIRLCPIAFQRVRGRSHRIDDLVEGGELGDRAFGLLGLGDRGRGRSEGRNQERNQE